MHGKVKTWDCSNNQNFHEHKPPAARTNVLTHVGWVWPAAIKLNPSGKTEVRKSPWIKPWQMVPDGAKSHIFVKILVNKFVLSTLTCCYLFKVIGFGRRTRKFTVSTASLWLFSILCN